ncbi:MAG: hypothetical protein V7637_5845 [Mycobacteriales bacterium]|jgi:hypothetical protein
MGEVRPLPTLGGVFFDTRRSARAMRVSWHTDDGSVVLSIWDGAGCTGTIRLLAADVPELIRSLGLGLPEWQPAATGPVPSSAAEPASGPDGGPSGEPDGGPAWPTGEPSRTD